MSRYLEVQEGLYLVQKEVVQEKAQEENVTETTNHIFIYDRSGSMQGLLSRLVEDLIERCKQIPAGDTVSLGWFSSEGQYSFILKGFKITDSQDYTILENAIRKNNYTIGLTCFSEILHETADNVIKDLSVFSERYALTFFTDGYPVVSNYQREVNSIYAAIQKLEKQLTASLLVGYGNYYNKDLMGQMAERLGGSLVHSADLPAFNIALSNFIVSVKDSEKKIKVKVGDNPNETYFSVSGSNINIYTPIDGEILFTPLKGRKNYLFVLTDKMPVDGTLVKLTDGEVGKNTKIEAFIKGVYAAAYLLVQKAKTNTALDILSLLGDKGIIDAVANAFTNDEYGKAEKRISECIESPNKRFLNGRNTSYLPKKDAFCLLDAIDALISDDEAYFYPTNHDFKYKRIRTASVPKDGYPDFEANSDNKCQFSKITWNSSLLNLSVLARLTGIIKLKKNYKNHGFSNNKFHTFVWRNYTLVKDGILNVTKLPVSFSEDTFNKLQQGGIIGSQETYSADRVYTLDLTTIPIMNRIIAEGETSAKKLFSMSFAELAHKAQMKTFKFLKNELVPEKETAIFGGLTEGQVEYLAELGVTDKGFSPPCDKIASTDYYYAKEFKVAIKKYSSLPKIDDVRKKIETNKKLTPTDELIQGFLELFDKEAGTGTEKEKLKWLDNQIEGTNIVLRKISSQIQKVKFAIILGNQWFDEFDSRENCTMEMGGVEFEVKLNSKKIDI